MFLSGKKYIKTLIHIKCTHTDYLKKCIEFLCTFYKKKTKYPQNLCAFRSLAFLGYYLLVGFHHCILNGRV